MPGLDRKESSPETPLFRTRAITHLLLENIAGIDHKERSGGEPEAPDLENSLEQLARARRRAILVIALDWVALSILVFARTKSGALFAIGPSEDSIFTLGILAIAAHSGFRLGQLEKLAAVQSVLEDLALRSSPIVEPPDSP